MTIFIAALTPLYRTHLLRSQPMTIPSPTAFMEDDMRAAQHGIGAIRNQPYDKNDLFRGDLLESMVARVFGGYHETAAASQGESTTAGVDHQRPKAFSLPAHAFSSQSNSLPQVKVRPPSSDRSIPTEASISVGPRTSRSPSLQERQQQNHHGYNRQNQFMGPPQGTPMNWSEHRIAHLTAHEDLRDLVHEVFSPAVDPWTNAESSQYPG